MEKELVCIRERLFHNNNKGRSVVQHNSDLNYNLRFNVPVANNILAARYKQKILFLIPLVTGHIYCINIFPLGGSSTGIGVDGFILQLNIQNNFLLTIESVVDLLENQQEYLNLMLVASLSNNTLCYFQSGTQGDVFPMNERTSIFSLDVEYTISQSKGILNGITQNLIQTFGSNTRESQTFYELY